MLVRGDTTQQSLVLSIGRALDPADGDEQTQAYMVEWLTWINDLVESGTWVSGGQLDSTGREVSKDTITGNCSDLMR